LKRIRYGALQKHHAGRLQKSICKKSATRPWLSDWEANDHARCGESSSLGVGSLGFAVLLCSLTAAHSSNGYTLGDWINQDAKTGNRGGNRIRLEGALTPRSTQSALVFLSNVDMFEWRGSAVDPVRQIAIANPIAIPFVSKLIPRGEDCPIAPNAAHLAGSELGVHLMYGAPAGVVLHPFLSTIGLPCKQLPRGSWPCSA
jgi:hypothetical protein